MKPDTQVAKGKVEGTRKRGRPFGTGKGGKGAVKKEEEGDEEVTVVDDEPAAKKGKGVFFVLFSLLLSGV